VGELVHSRPHSPVQKDKREGRTESKGRARREWGKEGHAREKNRKGKGEGGRRKRLS